MAQLTPEMVHIDQPLTNLTIAYLQSTTGFVADRVFPRVPVMKKTDKFYVYDRENFNRTGNVQQRAPRTKAPRVGMTLSQDSYTTSVFSLSTDFDFETLANEDAALNIRQAGVEMLTMQLLIDKEIKWADAYFAASIWGTEYTGVASTPSSGEVYQWSDYTNSTPIQDVTTAMRAVQLKSGGFKPNVMVMGKEVRDVLIHHPDFIDRINGGATAINPALITDQMIAQIFGVEEVMVMEAVKNTAKEGLTESNSFIGGKQVLLVYRPQSPGLMVPAAGYTFTWAELDNASGFGIDVRSYTGDFLRVEGIAEMLEANMAYDHKVIGDDLGCFFASIVA